MVVLRHLAQPGPGVPQLCAAGVPAPAPAAVGVIALEAFLGKHANGSTIFDLDRFNFRNMTQRYKASLRHEKVQYS